MTFDIFSFLMEAKKKQYLEFEEKKSEHKFVFIVDTSGVCYIKVDYE